ncbi:hypothetical protein D3C76_1235050 [compost metagenome]
MRAVQWQVQHTHCPLGRDIGLALTGADHQCTDIEVMPRPFRVELDGKAFALCGYVDFLPPQWPFTGFHQQVTIACSRRCHRHVNSVAVGIRRFIQHQLDLVGPHRPALGVILGTVAGPEAQAAEHAGLRVLDLDPIRAPLDREADLGRAAFGDVEGLLAQGQILLVEVIAPAVVLRVVPVVVAALAHQAHLEVLCSELVALVIGHQHFEFHRRIAIGFLALE